MDDAKVKIWSAIMSAAAVVGGFLHRALGPVVRTKLHKRREAKKRDVEEKQRSRETLEYMRREFMPNGGYNIHGDIKAIRGMLTSLTHKQDYMDLRARFSMESLAIMHARTDKFGNWLEVDGALQRLTGLAREDFLGRNWYNQIAEPDRDHIIGVWENSLENDLTTHMMFAWQCASGRPLPVEMRAGPLKTPDGDLMGYAIVMTKVDMAIYDPELSTREQT